MLKEKLRHIKTTLHISKNLLEWGDSGPEVVRRALQTGARGKCSRGQTWKQRRGVI